MAAAVSARAETLVAEADDQPYVIADSEDGADGGNADTAPLEPRIVTGGHLGYRFLQIDGYGGRGAEFDYLHSSPVFGAYYNRLGANLKYSLDGSFLNDHDYYGDLLFDYRGDYRFHIRTESMFHNLDREELFTPDFFTGRADSPSVASYVAVPDPTYRYGIRTEQDLATFRYKIHDFPFHLNLGYWRLFREGNRQQIFADQAFEGPLNRIYAVSRPVDRKTHEGTIGFDTHLGPVDLIYSFQVRQFADDAPIPVTSFVGGNPLRVAGLQQHNEDPDSRLISHTVKFHTSLAGGLVGAASYSYGKRENLSRLSDISGADGTSTTLHNAATDFVYTPCKEFSLAIKYRLQEVDHSTPATIGSRFTDAISVRPTLDSVNNIVTATLSVRPANSLTFVGEYRGSFLRRSDLGDRDTLMHWRDLPETTTTHRGRFSVISRAYKGLRLKAQYEYSSADTPSYGTSFSERHEGQLLATYNSSNRWGATAGYVAARDSNDVIARSVILTFPDITFGNYGSPLARDKRDNRLTASLWATPLTDFTVTASYGFLRTSVDQSVLFTSFADAVSNAAAFTSQAHVYALNSTYRLNENLDLSVLLQQVRSLSEFDPAFLAVSQGGAVIGDTASIRDISRTKTVESTVSARTEYRITQNVSCAFDYSFRDYDDEASASIFNGTIHSYMLLLNAAW